MITVNCFESLHDETVKGGNREKRSGNNKERDGEIESMRGEREKREREQNVAASNPPRSNNLTHTEIHTRKNTQKQTDTHTHKNLLPCVLLKFSIN